MMINLPNTTFVRSLCFSAYAFGIPSDSVVIPRKRDARCVRSVFLKRGRLSYHPEEKFRMKNSDVKIDVFYRECR